jgi:hypothetical protein
MLETTRTRVGLTLVAAASLALTTASRSCAQSQQYVPQVLFSVPYGMEPDQIGIHPSPDTEESGEPYSVGPLTVPAEGMILFVDRVQGRVKRFSSNGELIATADRGVDTLLDAEGQPDVLVPLDGVGTVVAGPDGRFYTGGHRRVQVFTPSGSPERSVRDSAGRVTQPAGWDLLIPQIRAAVMYEGDFPYVTVMSCDQYSNLYLGISPAPNEYNVSLAKFGADLNSIGVVPGFMVGWDGRTYGWVASRYPEPNDQLRIYSPDGALEAVVTVRPPARISAGQYDSAKHIWHGSAGTLFDARGSIYKTYISRRPRDKWVELMPDFKITDDIVVYKFDSKGNFLLKLVLDGLPFGMYPPVAVDPAGNIYHLEYYKDHVDFVKEALILTSP